MPNTVAMDVAFLPRDVRNLSGSVAVVLDVLRASSTIVTLFDRGARSIGLAESVETARAAAKRSPGTLLCGEVGGLAPYGFQFGNSPNEFAQMDLQGKDFAMATTNGTAAVRACREAGALLVGSLLNANAAIREALQLLHTPEAEPASSLRRPRMAEPSMAANSYGDSGAVERPEAAVPLNQVVFVCAGANGQFVLDDAVAAGYLCHILLNEARVRKLPVVESNSAIAAYRLYHSYPNLLAALHDSDSAQNLMQVRLGADVPYCARTSITKQVPRLSGGPEGLYLL